MRWLPSVCGDLLVQACGSPKVKNSECFAGTLPPAWFAHGSASSGNLSALDVSYNDLNGSLPAAAAIGGAFIPAVPGYNGTAAATVTLDPMNAGYGLCGALPAGIFAISAGSDRRLQGTLPSGPCNGTGGTHNIFAAALKEPTESLQMSTWRQC